MQVVLAAHRKAVTSGFDVRHRHVAHMPGKQQHEPGREPGWSTLLFGGFRLLRVPAHQLLMQARLPAPQPTLVISPFSGRLLKLLPGSSNQSQTPRKPAESRRVCWTPFQARWRSRSRLGGVSRCSLDTERCHVSRSLGVTLALAVRVHSMKASAL